MKKRIEKGLKKLKNNPIVLMILPREEFHELNMHALNVILQQNVCGVYITLNRPHENLINLMKERDMNHENMFFIDCVSEKGGNQKNCVFLKSAKSLTNIAIALDSIYKNEQHDFIFLDSLDALSNYHKPEMIVRFGRSLINKIRENEMLGIMIGLHEDTDKKVIDELSIISDKVLDLTK